MSTSTFFCLTFVHVFVMTASPVLIYSVINHFIGDVGALVFVLSLIVDLMFGIGWFISLFHFVDDWKL